MARQFKVSDVVAARRLVDLGYIERPAFHRFYTKQTGQERTASATPGGDFYNLQGQRAGNAFGAAVLGAVRDGRITYTEAYSLTGLNGETFDRYTARLES